MVAARRLLQLFHVALVGLVAAVCRADVRPPDRTLQLGDNQTTALIKQCYGIYGCFAITKEWISISRPISILPQSPKVIRTRFCLYTPSSPTECQRLYDQDLALLEASPFLENRPVKFLVHGYLDSGEKRWIKRMVAELLAREDQNVLVVDWVGGSGPPYTQAVANIRLVGAIVGNFIMMLKKHKGADLQQVHIIGHSLGAHLAGYAGQFLRARQLRLGRITGLDPAEPHFENTNHVVRLDPSDAAFVDVIHSDSGPLFSGGLGLLQPLGHMDFYPNGGKKQPGCGVSVLDAIKKEEGSFIYGLRRFIGCNHLRAYEYFTESINTDCPFMAMECDSWERFAGGDCAACSRNHSNCHRLGYHSAKLLTRADRSKIRQLSRIQPDNLLGLDTLPGPRKFFLMTGRDSPFCRRHLVVTLALSDIPAAQRHGGDMGSFSVRFHSNSSASEWHKLGDGDVFFEPGQSYKYMTVTSTSGEPTAVELEWRYSSSVLNPLTWRLLSAPMIHVNRVTCQDVLSRRRHVFCGEDLPLKSGRPALLRFNARCRQQRPAGAGSLIAAVANLVDNVGDSVSGFVESDQNVIPTRRRRRRRRRRRWHRRPTRSGRGRRGHRGRHQRRGAPRRRQGQAGGRWGVVWRSGQAMASDARRRNLG